MWQNGCGGEESVIVTLTISSRIGCYRIPFSTNFPSRTYYQRPPLLNSDIGENQRLHLNRVKQPANTTLPLIDLASKFLKDGSLEHCYVIGVQHLLPTTLLMFQALFKKGLKPQNLALIGKCYSTHLPTYDAMRAEGIDVCPSSRAFDSHTTYDETFRENIEQFILARKQKIDSFKHKKVVILDDGGDNESHCHLDVTFMKDGQANQNLRIAKNIALKLLKPETSFKSSLTGKMRKDHRSDAYLSRALVLENF